MKDARHSIRHASFFALFLLIAPILLVPTTGCNAQTLQEETPLPPPTFGDRVEMGEIEHELLQEASGLVASRQNSGVLWAHNDSGDKPRVFAFTPDGTHLGSYTIAGIPARDWEDMAIGPGPETGVDYLYLGDIGDNFAENDFKYVFRVPEPSVDDHQAPVDTTLSVVETIRLRYPDGLYDAETLLLDPLTRDLYIVTKRDTTVNVYRAPYPQSTTTTVVMDLVTTLDLEPMANFPAGFQGATGGDIAYNGLEVLIKGYHKVYYWSRSSASAPLFETGPVQLPYVPEPQGEAIGWAADGSGYYTLSEEANNVPAVLYFYPRLPASSD